MAFRAWRIVDGRLLSPYIPCRWEGAVMHAECYPGQSRAALRARLARRRRYDPPHPDCQCGIYAYHRPGAQSYYGEFEWVEGIVAVWGRIEAHRDGLRAEHARVCALARRPGVATIAARACAVDLVERDELDSAPRRATARRCRPELVP